MKVTTVCVKLLLTCIEQDWHISKPCTRRKSHSCHPAHSPSWRLKWSEATWIHTADFIYHHTAIYQAILYMPVISRLGLQHSQTRLSVRPHVADWAEEMLVTYRFLYFWARQITIRIYESHVRFEVSMVCPVSQAKFCCVLFAISPDFCSPFHLLLLLVVLIYHPFLSLDDRLVN